MVIIIIIMHKNAPAECTSLQLSSDTKCHDHRPPDNSRDLWPLSSHSQDSSTLHNSAHFHISTIPDNPFQICARAGVSAGPGARPGRQSCSRTRDRSRSQIILREKVPWPEQRSFKVQTFCNISIPLNWSLVAQYCLTCSRLY